MTNIIELKDITKTYGTKIKQDVLKKVNLNIKRGSFNWVVGTSGSGKTTLLNIISGLDNASKGEVYIQGVEIGKLTKNEKSKFRAENLGFVFQFHYLLPEFNALENVLIPLRIQRKNINKEAKIEALELMDSIGIGKIYKQYPNELSGGEAQRTAIARAVVGKPSLVIADEPTGNLDSKTAKDVYKLLRDLHKQLNITFIIVTHDDITPIKDDRIITLKDGYIFNDEIVT